MKLIRLFAIGSLGLPAAALVGCIAEPTYSVVPEISLNQVALQSKRDQYGLRRDSLTLVINYQDGDGDLGLEASDTLSSPRKYIRRYANNFFIDPYVKSDATGQLVPLATARPRATGSYSQTFVHATEAANNRSMPIKGTLKLNYIFTIPNNVDFPRVGDEVQLHVSIADRALHESNVLLVPVTFPR